MKILRKTLIVLISISITFTSTFCGIGIQKASAIPFREQKVLNSGTFEAVNNWNFDLTFWFDDANGNPENSRATIDQGLKFPIEKIIGEKAFINEKFWIPTILLTPFLDSKVKEFKLKDPQNTEVYRLKIQGSLSENQFKLAEFAKCQNELDPSEIELIENFVFPEDGQVAICGCHGDFFAIKNPNDSNNPLALVKSCDLEFDGDFEAVRPLEEKDAVQTSAPYTARIDKTAVTNFFKGEKNRPERSLKSIEETHEILACIDDRCFIDSEHWIPSRFVTPLVDEHPVILNYKENEIACFELRSREKLFIESENDLLPLPHLTDSKGKTAILRGYSNGYYAVNDERLGDRVIFIKCNDFENVKNNWFDFGEVSAYERQDPQSQTSAQELGREETWRNLFSDPEEVKSAAQDAGTYSSAVEQVIETAQRPTEEIDPSILNDQRTSLDIIAGKLAYICNSIYNSPEVEEKRGGKMCPHPVQVLAVLKLVQAALEGDDVKGGTIAEIKTGEGKSFVIALASIILVSYGRKVDIATTNNALASRDAENQKVFYDACGVGIGLLNDKNYVPKNEVSNSSINGKYDPNVLKQPVVYSTNSDLQWLYLYSMFSLEPIRDREYDIVIVDEADNILLDQAINPALLSLEFPIKDLNEILKSVWDLVVNQHHSDASFVLQELQRTFPGNNFTPENVGILVQAAEQSEKSQENKQYIIHDGNKVQIMDENTGMMQQNTRWNSFIHEMIETKHGIKPQPSSVCRAGISQISYFKMYQKILGVTGTAGTKENEHQLFNEHYGLDVFKVPPHLKGQMADVEYKEYTNPNDVMRRAIDEALEKSNSGRPVLLFTQYVNESQEFFNLFKDHSSQASRAPLDLIQGIDDKKDALAIACAGGQEGILGRITIATIAAGRGTDIKVGSTAEKRGGLHAIITSRLKGNRTLLQSIGRTARQGQRGSCTIFGNERDFVDRIFIDEGSENLASLQEVFINELKRKWPWLFLGSGDLYQNVNYPFGATTDDILKISSEDITTRFYWPEREKVWSEQDSKNLSDAYLTMVLTAWGELYDRLSRDQNLTNLEFCYEKYLEFIQKLTEYLPLNCDQSGEAFKFLIEKNNAQLRVEKIFQSLRTTQFPLWLKKLTNDPGFNDYLRSQGKILKKLKI